MKKIFVIGFNKTATCTFHHLFLINGLLSQHATKWETDNYQCFSDNGNLNNYQLLDKKYKDAIFILNTRSLDLWLISRFKHGIRFSQSWAYPYSAEKCETWIRERESYYLELFEYFSDKQDRLIIVNIEKNGWLEYITTELKFQIKYVSPKNVNETNLNDKQHQEIIQLVNTTLDKLNYDKKTILIQNQKLLQHYLTLYKHFI